MTMINTDTLTSISTSIGGGFFGGLLLGYALKKVIKMLAVVVGLFLAGLAFLQYQQIASINWNKIEWTITKLATVITSTINDNSNVAAVAMMSNFGIPLTSSMSIGFTIGFMKGQVGKEESMLFRNMLSTLLFSSSTSTNAKDDKVFENIIGYDNIKRLFRMALESNDHTVTSILLSGPPASAKTLFLQSLIKLQDSYFIDCSNATKSGLVDYIFNNKPKHLLLDELDKLSRKDQTFLLNLMETGMVSETKYNKTRSMEIKTSVFATSNNIEKIIAPLQFRFFIVKLEPYTYEQFFDITVMLLTSDQHSVDEEIAKVIADAVWNTSSTTRNIRDCVRVAKMAKSVEDVKWLVKSFL
jgi:holliday junction DNA helicase RuvB